MDSNHIPNALRVELDKLEGQSDRDFIRDCQIDTPLLLKLAVRHQTSEAKFNWRVPYPNLSRANPLTDLESELSSTLFNDAIKLSQQSSDLSVHIDLGKLPSSRHLISPFCRLSFPLNYSQAGLRGSASIGSHFWYKADYKDRQRRLSAQLSLSEEQQKLPVVELLGNLCWDVAPFKFSLRNVTRVQEKVENKTSANVSLIGCNWRVFAEFKGEGARFCALDAMASRDWFDRRLSVYGWVGNEFEKEGCTLGAGAKYTSKLFTFRGMGELSTKTLFGSVDIRPLENAVLTLKGQTNPLNFREASTAGITLLINV